MIARQNRTVDEVIERSRAWRAIHMPHTIAQPEPALSAMCQIALDLAEAGYHVHPLVPRDKMPLDGGNGYKDATRDEATIRRWWAKTPEANVGINLALSGIVDIAPDCPEWSATFKARGMERTLLYTSGGGIGHYHALYRLPEGGPIARACVSGQYDIMSEGNAVAPGSIHPSGKPYALHTKLIPVADLPFAPAWAIDMLQAHVKAARKVHTPSDWQGIPRGATLAHSARFQALIRANEQLRLVCAGEAVTLTLPSGGTDSSPSIQRAVFVNQLIRAKYPHNEIRALALHFAGVLESKPKWYASDIDNLLRPIDEDGYTPNDYAPEPTRGLVASEPLHGGRHYEITADQLLRAYQQHAESGTLPWSIHQAAAQLHVSTGTIKRREADLIATGAIRRDYGRVILLAAIGSQCAAMPQTADQPRVDVVENTPIEPENVCKNAIGSQFDLPQQEAVNTPENAVCMTRAHVEITHSPRSAGQWAGAAVDEWYGIEAEIDEWKATTRDGRHFAALEARYLADLAGVQALRSSLVTPPRAGECVLSAAPQVLQTVVSVSTPQAPAYRVVASCALAFRQAQRRQVQP